MQKNVCYGMATAYGNYLMEGFVPRRCVGVHRQNGIALDGLCPYLYGGAHGYGGFMVACTVRGDMASGFFVIVSDMHGIMNDFAHLGIDKSSTKRFREFLHREYGLNTGGPLSKTAALSGYRETDVMVADKTMDTVIKGIRASADYLADVKGDSYDNRFATVSRKGPLLHMHRIKRHGTSIEGPSDMYFAPVKHGRLVVGGMA